MKPQRIVNDELREVVSKLPCLACPSATAEELGWIIDNLRDAPRISDPDHITTRGAGGDDTAENMWPLCRRHHDERGNLGLGHMIRTYPRCRSFLEAAGRTDILEAHG